MATTTYSLPAGAEAFIMERLAALLPLAFSAPVVRLASVVKAAEREYPELDAWPAGLLLHSVRHADVRVMADLAQHAGKPRPFRLVGEDDDRLVVNDIIRDAEVSEDLTAEQVYALIDADRDDEEDAMDERLKVIGRPDSETRFRHVPRRCPSCGSEDLSGTLWYSRDGTILFAECHQCTCHFGVSGIGFDPEDADEDPCDHVMAEGIGEDGVTPSGADRCVKCGDTA